MSAIRSKAVLIMSETYNWGSHKLCFGKYIDKTFAEVRKSDISYIEWMVQTFEPTDQRWIAANAVLSDMPIPELKASEPQDETIRLVSFKSGMIGVQAPFSAKERCQALSERRWEKKTAVVIMSLKRHLPSETFLNPRGY
jgi:hypothetical protein